MQARLKEATELYYKLYEKVTPNQETTETGILELLAQTDPDQTPDKVLEEKTRRLNDMLILLDDRIGELIKKYDALPENDVTKQQYGELITWLHHYSKSMQRKLQPENVIQRMANALYNSVDDHDLDKMTGVTFTLIFQANHFIIGTPDQWKESDLFLVQNNAALGKKWAEETSHFSKFRFASGLALMIFGIAATMALAITLAPYAGISLGIGAVVLGVISQATSTMAILSALYAITDFVTGIARRRDNGGEQRAVPLFAGTVTGTTAGITAAATGAAATTAFTIGGAAASVVYSIAAFVRGGHLMWTSGAQSNRQREYAEKALEMEKPAQGYNAPRVRRSVNG